MSNGPIFFADAVSFTAPNRDFYMGPVNPQGSPTHEVVAGDLCSLTTYNSPTVVSASLPTPVNELPKTSYGSVHKPYNGWFSWHKNIGAAAVVFTPNGALIDSAGAFVLQPGKSVMIVCNGVNYWTV